MIIDSTQFWLKTKQRCANATGMFALALAGMVSIPSLSYAGIYGDDMGRCFVSQTSQSDRTIMIKWVFAIAALHPDVASVSAVNAQQRDAIDHKVASLLGRLLTKDCRTQSMDAMKYEGSSAFESSFQLLGSVAMREVMTNETVSKGFLGFAKYMDPKALEELAPKSAPSP